MTLTQLRMLQQIVDKGSLRAAAETMFRTAPTVSVAIKNLEKELGVQIFFRDRYRVTLTPAGEALYRKARTLLRQADEFENLGRHLAMDIEPEIRLAVAEGVPIQVITDTLRNCSRRFPDTRISLLVENIMGPMEHLQNGNANLAVLFWTQENLEVESVPVLSIPLVPVATPDFPPLKLEQQPIPADEMRNQTQIILKGSSRSPTREDLGVMQDGRRLEVSNEYFRKELILAGTGWGRLPVHRIQEELRTKLLIPLQIENYPIRTELQVRVARQANQAIGPVASALWEDVIEFAREFSAKQSW